TAGVIIVLILPREPPERKYRVGIDQMRSGRRNVVRSDFRALILRANGKTARPEPVRTGKSRVVAKVHHLRMDVAFKPLLERLQVPHCWPSFEYADTSHLDVPQRSESPSWLQDEHLAFID